MQQQIQVRQPPAQLLSEAAMYFTRRQAKVSDRTERGFRFGLEGAEEGGRLTVTPRAGGASTVTVEAEGLGVLAIADGYMRELRKQARDADRQGRAAAASSGRTGLGDLRRALGMPEPPPVRRPPLRPAAPSAPAETEAAAAEAATVAGTAASGHPNPGSEVTRSEVGTPGVTVEEMRSRDLDELAGAATPAPAPGHDAVDPKDAPPEQTAGVPAAEEVQVQGKPAEAAQHGAAEAGRPLAAELGASAVPPDPDQRRGPD
jgi:hypothetical protein